MSRSTRISLLNKIGVQVPIIQAPMAGISTPKLAAEISNAGGLGSLGLGAMIVENAQKAIREIRSLTNRPFNVNLFCHAPAKQNQQIEARWISYLKPYFEEFGGAPPENLREIYQTFLTNRDMFEMLLQEKPPVISFHFGLPERGIIEAFHEKGIFLLASATSLKEAKIVEDAGIDAIVAQGYEAGGHRGIFDPNEYDERLGTLALVRLLVNNTTLPVIAAGGIMDGAGIDAALSLGAEGVQMGTAFVPCPESSADEVYRKRLLDGTIPTIMTKSISGRPARGLINKLASLESAQDAPKVPDYPNTYDIGKKLNDLAKSKGNYEFGAHWAGQGAPLSRSLPAAELIRVLKAEVDEANRSRIDASIQREGHHLKLDKQDMKIY